MWKASEPGSVLEKCIKTDMAVGPSMQFKQLFFNVCVGSGGDNVISGCKNLQ